MTPQSLLHELDHGSEDSVVELLATASEKERKEASVAIIERLDRAARPWVQRGLTPALARRMMFQSAALERKFDNRPQLALIGTGTFGEIKRYGMGVPSKAFDVLSARKPKWLADWCKWVLSVNHLGWSVVRRLVREGFCERPDTDEYYLYMIHNDARTLLANDPGLLERELWELFRRQGTTQASLTQDYYGWSDALVALSEAGSVPRHRLLDASLEALELPFKAHHTTWYRNFHETLKPTIEERAARLPLYLALASSPVPPTVKFAVKAIETVEKARALPSDAILDSAATVLAGKEKGTATTVLRLLERTAASDPASRDRVAAAAAVALEHPAADVQSSALDLLERLGAATPDLKTPDLKTLIASKLELASAPVRERAKRWLGSRPDTVSVERYTTGWSRPDPLERERAIEPIEDVEDLVLTMTRVMNQGGPPDDVERVLDGLSRLCADRPPRFDDLTSPLRNQVALMCESGFLAQFGGVYSIAACMAQLGAAWLLDKMALRLGESALLLQATLAVRPYWVAHRVRQKKSRSLFSAPTHAGGWIDPLVLVQRLLNGSASDDREIHADVIQALFRLAPTRRAEALDAARDLSGEVGAAVRYALGGDETPRVVAVQWLPLLFKAKSALWSAASHARKPVPSAYRLHWGRDKFDPQVVRASMSIEPAPGRDVLRLADVLHAETQPLSNSHRDQSFTETDPVYRGRAAGPDLLCWASLICPGNREDWCALGAFMIANNLDWNSANWNNRTFLTVFEEPYFEMGPAAYLLLALGVMTREATEFDVARDGLARVIEDWRLDPRRMGATFADLFAGGVVRGARLAKAFTDVARMSARHADAIRQTMEYALAPGLPPRPADQSALLEAFLEACSASGMGPSSRNLRKLLESVSGSGKGPKLARSLLALPAEMPEANAESTQAAANLV